MIKKILTRLSNGIRSSKPYSLKWWFLIFLTSFIPLLVLIISGVFFTKLLEIKWSPLNGDDTQISAVDAISTLASLFTIITIIYTYIGLKREMQLFNLQKYSSRASIIPMAIEKFYFENKESIVHTFQFSEIKMDNLWTVKVFDITPKRFIPLLFLKNIGCSTASDLVIKLCNYTISREQRVYSFTAGCIEEKNYIDIRPSNFFLLYKDDEHYKKLILKDFFAIKLEYTSDSTKEKVEEEFEARIMTKKNIEGKSVGFVIGFKRLNTVISSYD